MWCFPFPRTTRESIGWRRNTHARPARSSSSVGGVPDSTVALTCAVVSAPLHDRRASSSFSMLPSSRIRGGGARGSTPSASETESIP